MVTLQEMGAVPGTFCRTEYFINPIHFCLEIIIVYLYETLLFRNQIYITTLRNVTDDSFVERSPRWTLDRL